MESFTSGTVAGAGSFRCRTCRYVLTLGPNDVLTSCPECGGERFTRASLFTEGEVEGDFGETAAHDVSEHSTEGTLSAAPAPDREQQLARARASIERPGDYLCYEDGSEMRTVAIDQAWTRIGRSLAADVRFDDPTVSRRHALIVRDADGVRVLDDRSLNGVFVNGSRVDGRTLQDGDEIIVGRYRLAFLVVVGEADGQDARAGGTGSIAGPA